MYHLSFTPTLQFSRHTVTLQSNGHTGALDKICGYGAHTDHSTGTAWKLTGVREQILSIAKARNYPVGDAEKRCAPCDVYVHCFQVGDPVQAAIQILARPTPNLSKPTQNTLTENL